MGRPAGEQDVLKVPIVKQHRGEIEVEESDDDAARLGEEEEEEEREEGISATGRMGKSTGREQGERKEDVAEAAAGKESITLRWG